MKTRKRLGEVLVNQGILSEEMLAKVLSEQRKTNLKFGQYLLRQGIVKEKQISGFVGAISSTSKSIRLTNILLILI
jgi:type IV pilus assembly protein PilB